MAASAKEVDRQETTPFLLRLFYKQGSFHRLDEFDTSGPLPQHVQVYTWPNCTLRELCQLLLTAMPSLLPRPYAGTRIAFRLIYPDMQAPTRPGAPGRYISRELGSVIVGAAVGGEDPMDTEHDAASVAEALKQLNGEPLRTLADAKFIIGDYVACAIFPPLPDGSVQSAPPPPSGMARGPPPRDGYGGGRGRENGYGGRGDYGYGRGGGRGRYDDRRPSGGLPSGEWRRGEAPPGGDGPFWRGGGRGRGRGGRW